MPDTHNPQRRRFLRTLGVGTAAAGVGAAISHDSSEASTRHMTASDSSGAQGVPAASPLQRGASTVASAEALRKLKGDGSAILAGHAKGTRKGGGIYLYDPDNEIDNGATHIGKWVLQPGQAVTPYHFGAVDGFDTDSVDPLEAYFEFLADRSVSSDYQAEVIGEYGVSRTLDISGVKRMARFELRIQATEPLLDVVQFRDCGKAFFHGHVYVAGNHGEASGIRLGDHGTVNAVRIESCRAARLPDFEVRSVSGWGIYHADGNSNMMEIGKVVARDCGASNRKNRNHQFKVKSVRHDDRSNFHQRSYIELSEDAVLPSEAHMLERSYVIAPWTPSLTHLPNKRLPYRVISVDREKRVLEVYPRMTDKVRVDDEDGSEEMILGEGSQLGLVFGGAVLLKWGGHCAQARVGSVAATRCGTGVWLTESSTPCFAGYVGQFCGVDIALGKDPDNAFSGGWFESGYFEASAVASIIYNTMQTRFLHGTVFGSITSLDFMSKVFFLKPQTGRATPRGEQRPFNPISMPYKGAWLTPPSNPWKSLSREKDSVAATELQPGDSRGHFNHIRSGSNPQLHLRDDADAHHHRGVQHITYTLYGNGKRGQLTSQYRIHCDEGYNINGQGQELLLPEYEVPVTINALLTHNSTWFVTIMKHEIP